MTTPTEPEMPWLQPAGDVPARPANRRRIAVMLLPVLGLLVLCCGGGVLGISVFRGGSHKSDNSGAPTLVVPSSTPAPQPTAAPSVPPTTKGSPSASPRSTTHRPRPSSARPTTTKPRTSAPTPSPGVQQNVRLGEFCSPAGAFGLTKRGRVLHCGPSVDDPRNRWRAIA